MPIISALGRLGQEGLKSKPPHRKFMATPGYTRNTTIGNGADM
jgi:hypothetical protein